MIQENQSVCTPLCITLRCWAHCDECGQSVPNAHCPTIAHGFHCEKHCPVCNGVTIDVTAEEVEEEPAAA